MEEDSQVGDEEFKMTEEDYEDVLMAIRGFVYSGYDTAERIYEVVTEEMYEPEDIDVGWVRDRIAELFEAKLAEEKTWPAITDCDRLDMAFEELNRSVIIALQNAGMTQSDGWDDVREVYRERGGRTSGIEGYCFYHGQDLERVVMGDILYLRFGAMDQDENHGVTVGKRIVAILKSHKFEPEWNETFQQSMHIRGIDWKRRSVPSGT